MSAFSLDSLFADRKKLALAAVAVCLALYVDFSLVLAGQMKAVAAARQKIARTRTELDGIKRDMALMNQNAGETLPVSLRGEDSVPEILKYISSLAADHDIKILQMVPLKSREAKVVQSQSYLSLAIKLDLTGGYHDLGSFLSELARNEQPLFASELHIQQGEDIMKQRINLTLRTYVKK